MSIKEQTKLFNQTWKRLEAEGKCDSKGGCQYNRIKEEWSVYAGSLSLEEYIFKSANQGVPASPRQVQPVPPRDPETFVLLSWFVANSDDQPTSFFLISEEKMRELLTKKEIDRLVEYASAPRGMEDCSCGDEVTFAKHNKPTDPEELLAWRVGKILRALKPHMTETGLKEIVRLGQSIKLVVQYSYI